MEVDGVNDLRGCVVQDADGTVNSYVRRMAIAKDAQFKVAIQFKGILRGVQGKNDRVNQTQCKDTHVFRHSDLIRRGLV